MKSPCAAPAMVVYFDNGGVGCYHKSELKGWREDREQRNAA